MNVLLILSGGRNSRTLETLLRQSAVSKVFLCPIEYGCEEQVTSLSRLLSSEGVDFEPVDFLSLFNERAFRDKDRYLRYIYELGERRVGNERNVKEFLKIPGDDFSAWWLSITAEKNPYKSDVYTQIAKVATVMEAKERYDCSEIWIDGDSSGLSEVLRKNLGGQSVRQLFPLSLLAQWKRSGIGLFLTEQIRVVKFLFEMLFRIVELKVSNGGIGSRLKGLRESRWLLLTMFPSLDVEELDRGRFVNRAYGALQRSIEARRGERASWLAMFTQIGNLGWREAVRLARKINSLGETLVLHEELLGIKGFLFVLRVYGYFLWKVFLARRHFRGIFGTPFTDSRVADAWPFFKREFLSSFVGKELVVQLSYYYAFSEALKAVGKPARVLYFAEMHGWERALNGCARKWGDVLTVGLQHSVVPLLLLNYFHDPKELSNGGGVESTPTPDFLACTGEITRDLFLKNGWPPERTFVLGGFRFQELPRLSKNSPTKKRQIVVAFSISDEENEEILRMIHGAFNGKNVDFKVVFKSHPCSPIERVIRKLGVDLDPSVFSISEETLEDIVPESRVMIVKESSSLFHALAAGVPVVVPVLYGIVDLCPLTGVSDLAHYVKSPGELFRVVSALMAGAQRVDGAREARDFVESYLSICADEQEYFERLESVISCRVVQGGHPIV